MRAIVIGASGHFGARIARALEGNPGIAAQRAPRGAATIAGVFRYAGKCFKGVRGGDWRDARGWQGLRRVRIAGLGTRWAAPLDKPASCKIAKDGIAERGAHPCMGFPTPAEFAPEFARWGIREAIVEREA
jgi:hypothetical protein